VTGFLSSRPNRVPPPPHPQESDAPPFGSKGEKQPLTGKWVGMGDPIPAIGQTLWYYTIIPLRFTFNNFPEAQSKVPDL
jgi:hypothetical protein